MKFAIDYIDSVNNKLIFCNGNSRKRIDEISVDDIRDYINKLNNQILLAKDAVQDKTG